MMGGLWADENPTACSRPASRKAIPLSKTQTMGYGAATAASRKKTERPFGRSALKKTNGSLEPLVRLSVLKQMIDSWFLDLMVLYKVFD